VHKTGPRRIETSITVTRVGNIDTVNETVEAKLLIDAFWLPSADELNGGESGWEPLPNFQPVNATAIAAQELVKSPYLKDRDGEKVWHAKLGLDATFKQQFQLHAFPFDCQVLVLRIEMGNCKEMIYVPPPQAIVMSVERALCPLTGWTWVGASVNFTRTDPSLSKQGNSYAQFVVELKLSRQWQPYVWRVGLFVFMTMVSSVFVYAMDAIEDAPDRLGFAFTLLLTSVAFQFTVHGSLPQVSYLTLLEVYILASVVIIWMVGLWCALVKGLYISPFSSNDAAHYVAADERVFVLHLLFLIGFHVAAVRYCLRERGRQIKKLFQGSGVGAPTTNLRVMHSSGLAGSQDGQEEYTTLDDSAVPIEGGKRSSLFYLRLDEDGVVD